MTDSKTKNAVPTGRFSRFSKVAKIAGGMAGGMIAEGARQVRAGQAPKAKDMLLTPANAKRLADQLANMRGAAMKLGQMLSMDTGDFLPKELSDILAKLRSDGHSMPDKQLEQQLISAFGEDWQTELYGFDFNPIATASIGQVHTAMANDGKKIVLKVQFPGISESIDSDVDNISTLLRFSGALPKDLDLKPFLAEAKAQLHDEADYQKEAAFLQQFGETLAEDPRFKVPKYYPEYSCGHILAMEFIEATPIENIADLPQELRNHAIKALVELLFKELFELRMVQTDPNFANYMYQANSDSSLEPGNVVLLDFGATRKYPKRFTDNYKALIRAMLKNDEKGLLTAATKLGYLVQDVPEAYQQFILKIFAIVAEPLQYEGDYDFGSSDLTTRLNTLALEINDYKSEWQAPPANAVFLHRKLGGIFMLANRVKAQVNVNAILKEWI